MLHLFLLIKKDVFNCKTKLGGGGERVMGNQKTPNTPLVIYEHYENVKN